MKKTININLGGLVFQIDEDAFEILETYLNKVKTKYSQTQEQQEIVEDIEYRFAELFNEKLDKRTEVVSIGLVEETIAIMGEPELFEEETVHEDSSNAGSFRTKTKKLFRDSDDVVLGGVLSGLSAYFGISDPIWLRLITVIAVFAGLGFPIPVYIVLWIVVPKAVTASDKLQMRGEPVTINNIEEVVKKNVSSERIVRKSAHIAQRTGSILRPILKVALLIGAIILTFKVVSMLIVAALGMVMGSIALGPEIKLIFNNLLSFNAFILSAFLMIALPVAVLAYLAFKVSRGSKVNWSALSVSSIFLWIAGLLGVIGISISIAMNFNENSEKVEKKVLPVSTNTLYIESNSFKKSSNIPDIKSDFLDIEGFNYFTSKKEIELTNVHFKVNASPDTSFYLISTAKTNGKTLQECEELLTQIKENSQLLNDSTLFLPSFLTLQDATKFRNQRMKYELLVPENTSILFKDDIKDMSKSKIFKKASQHKYKMQNGSLVCLDCEE